MINPVTKRNLVAVVVLLVGTALSTATVSAQTTVVTDPAGDASVKPHSLVIPAYQDILRASVTLGDGQFVFVMDVAGVVPSNPALQTGIKLLDWTFRLDTDATTVPSGFPWAPGDRIHGAEFVIFVAWDGTRFTGSLIDRTPTLIGGEALVTPIPFTIQGSQIAASVEARLVGNPPSFLWRATTDIWFTQLGTEGFFQPDSAPDFGTAAWPGL